MSTTVFPWWRRLFMTEQQRWVAEKAAQHRKRVLETPAGLRSFLGDQQRRVDEMHANTEAFLRDIEKHFGDAAKYLTPAYTGRSKFENIEGTDKRRIGVQWNERVYTFNDCFITTISFVYTETANGVRIDYILKRISGPKDVINDDYNPEDDRVYKTQNNSDDYFRGVRRYESHEDFVNSGDHPPKWFVDALSVRKPSY